jgi:hypothetical protein
MDGVILWRVPDRSSYPGNSSDCPYVGMEINKEGQLVLFNWCDLVLTVDPKTGKVLEEHETR